MDRILFEKNVILKSDSQAAFFGRIQKRICDLISYGFLTTKKTEDPIKDHLPWQRNVVEQTLYTYKKHDK